MNGAHDEPDTQATYALALSHVVIDEIRYSSGKPTKTVMGGAGIHAAVGQALALRGDGASVLISGVGADFPAVARAELRGSGIDDTGLVAVENETPRTIITYAHEHDRTERPAFGLEHFERCDPQPRLVPTTRREPRSAYIFAGVTEPAWEVVDDLPDSSVVLWELDVAVCAPEFAEAIRSRAERVDVVSLNELELHGLTGGKTVGHLRRALNDLFPSVAAVALRRGERGAILATHSETWAAHPAGSSDVTDPTGAGNAFSGALSIAWARNSAPEESLRVAMAAAAVTVAHEGPVLPITTAVRQRFDDIVTRQEVSHRFWKGLV